MPEDGSQNFVEKLVGKEINTQNTFVPITRPLTKKKFRNSPIANNNLVSYLYMLQTYILIGLPSNKTKSRSNLLQKMEHWKLFFILIT